MIQSIPHRSDFSARLAFWLLTAFLVVLWFAGGASRADVAGQAVTRFFAWSFLIAFVLLSPRFEWQRVKPVALLLIISVMIVALQLVPLPPTLWSELPGHEMLVRAADVSGQPQPWRPISISPSATANALGSLIVPVTVLVLATNLTPALQWRICGLVLALVLVGCIPALLQVSGARLANPLLNQVAGSVSGNFANRNHFALFLALGCLIAPVWGFRGDSINRWKAIAALALVPFFLLTLLATGSRAGLALGAIALVLAFIIERATLTRQMRSLPRRVTLGIVAFSLLVLVAAITASIMFGRAMAVDRVLSLSATDDLRSQAVPYVIDAIARYFPLGSGFGTFDPTYRIAEPNALLRLVYFNHAHNDWLEIVLTGGLAGALLLGGALTWFAVATGRVWRGDRDEFTTLALVGAAGLFLIMIASVVDYPARTPMFMGIVMVAAIWLQMAFHRSSRPPRQDARP